MFQAPTSMILVGPSMCGKTTFIKNLINQRSFMINGEISKIYYCCPNLSYAPDEIISTKDVEPVQGLPDVSDLNNNSLLILDDFLLHLDKRIAEIFTVSCHHKNISVVLAIQNLYHRSCPWLRDISLNTQQIVLFRTLRDIQQIEVFFRQICPQNNKNLIKLYKEVTAQPYSYLVFDFSQKCNNLLRISTNIFNYGNFFECFGTDQQINQETKEEGSPDSTEQLLSCSVAES